MNPTERSKILDSLAAGELSVAEAMRLLDGSTPAKPVEAVQEPAWGAADDIPIQELKSETIKIESSGEEISIFKPATNGDQITEGEKPRWLKIRVRNRTSGHNKVSITLPIGLVRLALRIASHRNADMDREGAAELMKVLQSEQRGTLVEVEDEDDDQQVLIYLD
jgi:hypothetical protein